MDTIFALASGPGKAGVSVVRVSGPEAFTVGAAISGGPVPERRPVLRQLKTREGEHLDTALVLGFPKGGSFTGEPVVELHVHGSVAVVSAVLGELGRYEGLRPADAGEFTRRALENDQLDLAQVEGLGDLIEAETEGQRRQALRVLSGALGALAEGWRSRLIRAVALLEATIDFADEEVPEDVTPEVLGLLDGLVAELSAEVKGALVSERIREGFEVAILGAPNAGKSTLLNALARRDVAITSEIAGTTRDVIEVRMDLGGIAVTLLDTAGVRETEDIVESLGVERARTRAGEADLRIFVVTKTAPDPVLEPWDGDLVIGGKADLDDWGTDANSFDAVVSGRTGEGIAELETALAERLGALAHGSGTAMRARQRLAIARALSYIDAGSQEVSAGAERTEYAVEELLGALRALDVLVGRVDVEQVLDVIFSSFCVGK